MNLLRNSSVSEYKGALCDFNFLFTEFDCSVFGSVVLLYGL